MIETNVAVWAANQALNSGAPLHAYFWSGFGFFWVSFLLAWGATLIRNIIVGPRDIL